MDSATTDQSAASDNNAVVMIAVAASALGVATLLVAARLYTRLLIIKRIGLDDWAIIVAWVFTCATGIDMALATQHGLGRHTSALPLETVIEFLKYLFALIILYNIALTSVKASFLLQYRRVFTLSRMRITCDIGLAIVSIWGIFQVLMTVFFCKPISGFWDVTIQAECQPKLPFWFSNSVFNLLTDLAIFALPLPSLGRMHLGKVQKRFRLDGQTKPVANVPAPLPGQHLHHLYRPPYYPQVGSCEYGPNVRKRVHGLLVDYRARMRHHLHMHPAPAATGDAAVPGVDKDRLEQDKRGLRDASRVGQPSPSARLAHTG